ncbi:MAG: hypothetical protein PHD36_07390 [Desulfotomaculaceae bacterium]|nr:hypothetical protein [Desulfotomaculaceae bacterium]
MRGLKIDLEKFDLQGLVKHTLEFLRDYLPPSYAIPWIYNLGDKPVYYKNESDPDAIDRDYYNELVNEGRLLYFDFSESNLGMPIICADGNAYLLGEENDQEKYFCMSDSENLGYLLKYHDGKLTIWSARHSGGGCLFPPPSINIEEYCGIFDEPMNKFINKFMKK